MVMRLVHHIYFNGNQSCFHLGLENNSQINWKCLDHRGWSCTKVSISKGPDMLYRFSKNILHFYIAKKESSKQNINTSSDIRMLITGDYNWMCYKRWTWKWETKRFFFFLLTCAGFLLTSITCSKWQA